MKIAIIALHPVQYHTPLYRLIAESTEIDAEVIYLDRLGLEGVYDKTFKTRIVWDIPLLYGYKYEFVRNYAFARLSGFFSRINLGLFSALRKSGCDIVLIQGYSILSCWIALVSAKLLDRKIVWRGEVAVRPNLLEQTLRRKLKRVVVRYFLSHCDAVLYTCCGNRKFLEMHGVPPRRLFPFPCAVDNEWFRAQHALYRDDVTSIKRTLGIPSSHMVVLYCGRLTLNKHVMDVAKAVAMAGPAGISLVVVGDGPLKDELEAFAGEHAIDLHVVGFVNQSVIGKYYSLGDVFMLVSEQDPSPKALNEALNFCVVPIVSNGVGTAMDLVDEGISGYVVDVGDVQAMAAWLVALRDNPDKRRSMAQAAWTRVGRFDFRFDVVGLEQACRAVLRKQTE